MRSIIAKTVILVIPCALLVSCANTDKKEAAPAPAPAARVQPSWNSSMLELSKTLSRLMPILAASDLSREPTDRAEALALSKRLARNAHRVDRGPQAPSADPALQFVSRDFRAETESVIRMMESGQWKTAQSKMMNASRYCVACHTMQPAAASGLTVGFDPDLSRLDELQRADFYAAIRQFDPAIIHYENALARPDWARANEEKWNDGFKKLLAITVRTRSSASLTLELISRFFDSGSYPQGLKGSAFIWRQHAKEWRLEKPGQDLIAKARGLIAQGKRLQMEANRTTKQPADQISSADPQSPGSSASLVLFLRASGLIHTFLISKGHAKNQEALYLAGQAAEGLAGLNFWTYPEDYYSACSRINPKSKTGRVCADALTRMNAAKTLTANLETER